MKKIVTLLSLTTLFFVGCNAHAQTNSIVVGNPDSANTLLIDHTYETVNTIPPQPVQPVQVEDTMAPNSNFNTPAQPVVTGSAVVETITETGSPALNNVNMNGGYYR